MSLNAVPSASAGRSPGRSVYPVILSGGAGTRLWPMSRERYPKQLLNLVSDQSMLQDTVARVTDAVRFAAPLVICNEQHRFVIAEQLRQIGIKPLGIILEPLARNTAAAAAVAALRIAESDPEALMLILPADHQIGDVAGLLAVVDQAVAAAERDNLVVFGISPAAPETAYGYIRRGSPVAGLAGVWRVDAFVEKPDRRTAERFLAGGEHFWNSGMFVFPVQRYLAELERCAPAILAACRRALADGVGDLDFFRLNAAAFGLSPSTSIDYAVMEHTDAAVMVPADIGWSDVGAWSSLWQIGDKDADGNVVIGDVMIDSARNCYLRSETMLTAVVGLDDVIVVVTEDAILVAAKDQVQNVKGVVERLRAAGRSEPIDHHKVHRPWGFSQSVHGGERFEVRRLTVNPGGRLSLHKHYHRAEHWVVVNGTALVTRDGDQVLVRENESIYLPLGAVHQLENPGKVPLNLIEVQSGGYLGEDDIVRLADSYGPI